jgi:hypothetical protein
MAPGDFLLFIVTVSPVLGKQHAFYARFLIPLAAFAASSSETHGEGRFSSR